MHDPDETQTFCDVGIRNEFEIDGNLIVPMENNNSGGAQLRTQGNIAKLFKISGNLTKTQRLGMSECEIQTSEFEISGFRFPSHRPSSRSVISGFRQFECDLIAESTKRFPTRLPTARITNYPHLIIHQDRYTSDSPLKLLWFCKL